MLPWVTTVDSNGASTYQECYSYANALDDPTKFRAYVNSGYY